MTINNKYELSQVVFLLTDTEQLDRIVTCIQISGNNQITYLLSCGSLSSWHYDYEMISTKDIVKQFQ